MSSVAPVFLVCASRVPRPLFARATQLGRSWSRLPKALRPSLYLRADNHGDAAVGLPEHYNAAIEELPASAVLVFVHDDVYLHDWFFLEQLQLGLEAFDLIGVVGCRTPAPDQPGWPVRLAEDGTPRMVISQVGASGVINHFDPAHPQPEVFGPTRQAVELLDGCLLACRRSTLLEHQLRFDPQFRFHCYDTDFCRTARARGLRLGTWPLMVTHESAGNYDERWEIAARTLQAKWAQ
jgi:GT2 family glycosyltransferase